MSQRLQTRFGDPSQSPGLGLWRVTNSWQRCVRAALLPHGLTHVQFVLLAFLTWTDRASLVTQKDLADQAGTDVMMTSQVVRVLEQKGYLTRSPHPSDGRAIVIAATPEGVAIANLANTDVEEADQAFFRALSPVERTAFTASLSTLVATR